MMCEQFPPPWHPDGPKEVLQEFRAADAAHLQPTEEEKKTLWRRFIEWLKQLPAYIKNKLLGLELDIHGTVTLEDLLSMRNARLWYDHSKTGTEIKCPTELKPGDHIAVKIKRSHLWWNHMIVTEEYIDGFDAICPCKPALDPNEVKLESDYFSPKDILHFFRMDHRQCEMKIWEFPVMWDSVEKAVRFDYEEGSVFSQEIIVQRARERMGREEVWDFYNRSTEDVVAEIIHENSHVVKQTQRELRQKCIDLGGTIALSASALSIKNICTVFVTVLRTVKLFISEVVKDAPKILMLIAKIVKTLKILGYCLGPIVDIVVGVLTISIKLQSYKKGEITKKAFYKFFAQKVAEIVTDLLFSASIIAANILLPFLLGSLVSIFISIIGFIVAKIVGWLFGSAAGFFLDKFITED